MTEFLWKLKINKEIPSSFCSVGFDWRVRQGTKFVPNDFWITPPQQESSLAGDPSLFTQKNREKQNYMNYAEGISPELEQWKMVPGQCPVKGKRGNGKWKLFRFIQ